MRVQVIGGILAIEGTAGGCRNPTPLYMRARGASMMKNSGMKCDFLVFSELITIKLIAWFSLDTEIKLNCKCVCKYLHDNGKTRLT